MPVTRAKVLRNGQPALRGTCTLTLPINSRPSFEESVEILEPDDPAQAVAVGHHQAAPTDYRLSLANPGEQIWFCKLRASAG